MQGLKLKKAAIGLLLAAIAGCSRQDGLFQCDYSTFKNPPVNFRYDRSKKQITLINQGNFVVNKKYAAEEIGDKVMWGDSEYSSNILDRKTMILEDIFRSGNAFLDHTNLIQCKWQ